jgi:hypothetical protein
MTWLHISRLGQKEIAISEEEMWGREKGVEPLSGCNECYHHLVHIYPLPDHPGLSRQGARTSHFTFIPMKVVDFFLSRRWF